MGLPKSKNPRGYNSKEIIIICKERKISRKEFNKAMGCNTVTSDEKGNFLFYVCDVENALARLGHKDGINYGFD